WGDARLYWAYGRGVPAADGAADAAAQEYPEALCGSKQQRAGGTVAHADGAGRHADRPYARGLHVSVQLPVDEPVDRPLVFAAHNGASRRLDAGSAGTGAICNQQRAP